jgi:hypothetical protein
MVQEYFILANTVFKNASTGIAVENIVSSNSVNVLNKKMLKEGFISK